MIRRGDRGHTLLELLFALSIVGVALAGLYFVRFGPTISSGLSAGVDAKEARALEQRTRRMILDIQEGLRLIHPVGPSPGPSLTSSGVAFVDPRGEVILYYFEEGKKREDPGRIVRMNVNAQRRGDQGAREVVLEKVKRFALEAAEVPAGSVPALLHMKVAVQFDGNPAPRVIEHATSVFLRNVEWTNPDDVFPDGTPLL